MINFVFAASAAGLFLAIASPAFADFNVQLATFDPERVVVSVYGTGPPPWGTCPTPVFPNCGRVTYYVDIQPCPPGLPCDGGVSRVSVGGYPGTEIRVDYGETYQFTGFSIAETGPRVNGNCTYTCTYTSPSVVKSFDAPSRENVGYWILTPLETVDENMWVDVSVVSDFIGYERCTADCMSYDVKMSISPCPLIAMYDPIQGSPYQLTVTCDNGVGKIELPFLREPSPDVPVRLLLAPGDYTFTASFHGLHWWNGGGIPCEMYYCVFSAYPNPTAFSTNQLPVHETTWGQIKALYQR